jgi:short-subunit dehydrogenase
MACKAFLPALQKAEQGKIINMSSDMASVSGKRTIVVLSSLVQRMAYSG